MVAIHRAVEVCCTGTATAISIVDAEAELLISQNIVIGLCGHNLRGCAIAPLLVAHIAAVNTSEVGNYNRTNNAQHGNRDNGFSAAKALLKHDVCYDNYRSDSDIGERAQGIRDKGIAAHILNNKSQLLRPVATSQGLGKSCHAVVGNERHKDNHKHHSATRNTEGDILHLRRYLTTKQTPQSNSGKEWHAPLHNYERHRHGAEVIVGGE